jgi:hypothetical protein
MRARGSWNGHPSALHCEIWCKGLTRRFTAILDTCTCTPNTCIYQSLATYWRSPRRGANDDTRRAGGSLHPGRRRCFTVTRTSLNPTIYPTIDFAPQRPIPFLHRTLRWLVTAFLARLALATMGFWWIDVETVSKKRTYVSTLTLTPAHATLMRIYTPAAGQQRRSTGSPKKGT